MSGIGAKISIHFCGITFKKLLDRVIDRQIQVRLEWIFKV